MNKQPIRNPHAARQFIGALVLVLTGVSLGSWIVLKKDQPGELQTRLTAVASMNADGSWTNEMAWIPGGTFWMGSEDGQPDERPVRQAAVGGFWIDKAEVT